MNKGTKILCNERKLDEERNKILLSKNKLVNLS